MLDALKALEIDLTWHGEALHVVGRGGPLVTSDIERELYLGMAGTAYRPLTASLCLGRGTFRLMGSQRMTERPIADLVDGLRGLGASIEYLGRDGYPPLRVFGTGLKGGNVHMRGSVSSQFLTSLMMAAPLALAPVSVTIDGDQVSKPYLDITMNLMRRFGVQTSHDHYRRFDIPTGRYRSPVSIKSKAMRPRQPTSWPPPRFAVARCMCAASAATARRVTSRSSTCCARWARKFMQTPTSSRCEALGCAASIST